jgi:hypothetical protein
MIKEKTGELKSIGEFGFGWYKHECFECVDCGTVFPKLKEYNPRTDEFEMHIKCNGHKINKCPWCRPDSTPWTNGRGI